MGTKVLLYVHPEFSLFFFDKWSSQFFLLKNGKEFSLRYFERVLKNDHVLNSPYSVTVCIYQHKLEHWCTCEPIDVPILL